MRALVALLEKGDLREIGCRHTVQAHPVPTYRRQLQAAFAGAEAAPPHLLPPRPLPLTIALPPRCLPSAAEDEAHAPALFDLSGRLVRGNLHHDPTRSDGALAP